MRKGHFSSNGHSRVNNTHKLNYSEQPLADYNEEFYQYQMQGSLRSAEVIVPIVLNLTEANSVIDIGCGVGTWLSVYQKQDVSDIQGVDGDYIDRNLLLINQDRFRAHDLSTPLQTGRTYELVQSLEVAEHIDPQHAIRFVGDLTQLGDTILFSAAVPFQLGTGHINEQYIDYWVKLFAAHDYLPIDAIRPEIWENELVEVCYRQNILLFAKSEAIHRSSKLAKAWENTRQRQLSIIHPDLYQPRIRRLLKTLLEFAKTVKSNGNLPLAQSILKSIVDFDPRNDQAWDVFGQLATQANNNEVAISHLKRAIGINPSEAGYHFNLGQIYANAGLIDEALEQFRLVLATRPNDTNIQKTIDLLENPHSP